MIPLILLGGLVMDRAEAGRLFAIDLPAAEWCELPAAGYPRPGDLVARLLAATGP